MGNIGITGSVGDRGPKGPKGDRGLPGKWPSACLQSGLSDWLLPGVASRTIPAPLKSAFVKCKEESKIGSAGTRMGEGK